MRNQWLTIRQLDHQLKEWQMVSLKYGRPREGWIKTLRKALCMTSLQLAESLKLTRARIVKLENAETHDAVTLRTLRETAEALGCEFVYAIVPKGNLTLEDMIKKRAEQLAQERVASVAHSMLLEAQSVDEEMLQLQKKELIKNLLEHLNKKIWDTSEKRNHQVDLRKKLMTHRKKKK